MTLVEETRKWADNYIRSTRHSRAIKLGLQKKEYMKYINTVVDSLKSRQTPYTDEGIKFIEKKIIPYLERMKWLPDSYMDILDNFESGKFEKEALK